MPTMRVRGIFGRPYVDLEPYLDLSPKLLARVHEEVCLGLAQIPVDYTGGSHRSMGIVPPSRRAECHVDYGEAIRAMSDDDFATLCSLSDEPEMPVPRRRAARAEIETEMGEEREHPLSRRQMLWLKYRFGVYFPWKVYVELVPNRWWGDKSRAEGKSFTRQARAFFPETVALVERLPFVAVGRCTIMGLEANDHGTVHHDGDPRDRWGPLSSSVRHPDPAAEQPPAHFVTICPANNKRLFLWEEEQERKIPVTARAYWFNDQDEHGVDADPFFRYSIRVDGVFEAGFLARVRESVRAAGGASVTEGA
jgi:hypothetical protein